MKIFYNSSMPRSGSTIMQNILGNNPEIYATPTSPLFEFIANTRVTYTKSVTVKALDSDEMKMAFMNFCKYGMHGYFYALTNKPYAVDKSRAWALNLPLLTLMEENPKIICMVRDLRDILASMEKNYRKHPDKNTAPATIVERMNAWLDFEGKPVGITLKNLKEVFHRGLENRILFVRYEDLVMKPKTTMNKVHDYLEIKRYDYDFNNIKQVTFEDDKFHGIYGDHKIKSKLKLVPSTAKELLGEEICNKIYESNKWYFEAFNYEL